LSSSFKISLFVRLLISKLNFFLIEIAALKLICCSIIRLHNAIAKLSLYLSRASISSPKECMKNFGFTVENVVNKTKEIL